MKRAQPFDVIIANAGVMASAMPSMPSASPTPAPSAAGRSTHDDGQGGSNRHTQAEVAEKLYISQKTVKNHLASIYQKLDARDRTQAVLQAVRMGIVSLD